MFNNEKFTNYKNIEIAKIIQTIASERKIDINKIFQITKFALYEVFQEVYGKAKLEIQVNKNSEIKIMQCFKIVSDKDAETIKYIYNTNSEKDCIDQHVNEFQNDHFNDKLIFNYNNQLDDEQESHESDLISEKIKEIENDSSFHYSTISLSKASKYAGNPKIGDILSIQIENAWQNLENNSKLAKIFNRSFFRFIDMLVKEQEYLFFSKKENQIINAFVKTANKYGYVLSHDNYEIMMPSNKNSDQIDQKNPNSKYLEKDQKFKSETIPGEYFGAGERIQVFIKLKKNDDVNLKNKINKYQVIASRIHPGFLSELLKQNVPEIRDGQIIIKDVQRIPGVRAKVLVFSTNLALDPVGACIGIRGVRIRTVSKELRGEKIDVIPYSDNLFDLAASALSPVKVIKINESEKYDGSIKLSITVDDKDLSSAIGKGGSNIKLISRILKCHIEIIGSTKEEERRVIEYENIMSELKEKLDIEDVIAQILIMNNFKSIEDIAYVDLNELVQIEYFDEDIASEIQNRALEFIYEEERERINKIDAKLKEIIALFDNEDEDLLKLFSEKELFSLKEVASMDIDEFLEKFDDSIDEISEDLAEDIILEARKAINYEI
jgi:transcription termination factor NusA